MLVKAKIIDTEMRDHKGKSVCDVTLKFSDPSDVTIVTLWNNVVAKEEHKPYAALAGQEVFIGIRPDVFNGKLQYQINTNLLPQVIKAPIAKVAAGG